MKGVAETLEVHGRVHIDSSERIDLVKEFIQKKADCHYLVKEIAATRPHLQFFAKFTCYKNIRSLRDGLKNHCKIPSGNGSYSVTHVRETPEVLICYLMKEEGGLVSSEGIQQWEAAAKLRAKDIEKKLLQKKNSRPATLFEQLVRDIGDGGDANEIPPSVLVGKILDWFIRKGKLIPDQSLMRKYVLTWNMRANPEKYREAYINTWKQEEYYGL